MRGQGIVCATVCVLSLCTYALIGLPGAFFLAVLAGILEAVPVMGPIFAAIGPLVVAASQQPDKILWVLAGSVVIQQFENYVLVPRIMDKSVGVNPMMTLLSIVGFGTLFGLLGAVLAIPLAAVLQTLLDHFLLGRGARAQIADGPRGGRSHALSDPGIVARLALAYTPRHARHRGT